VNQRLQRTSGGSDPAAAPTQRRQQPSGEEMEVQRTSGCGGTDPAAATTQRRGNGGAANQQLQRTNDDSDPATATTQQRQRTSEPSTVEG